MIIFIINSKKLRKLKLPNKVAGVYQVNDLDGKTLCNIEGINNEWIIKTNPDVEISNVNGVIKDQPIKEYDYFTIKKLITNEVTEIMAGPMYDTTTKYYQTDKTTVTIGSGSCDISYNFQSKIAGTNVTLTKVNNHWVAENNGTCPVFIMDKTFKKKNIFHGDYIFLYGLRVVVINNVFLVNNPLGQARVTLKEVSLPKPNVTYQPQILDDTPMYTKDDFFYKSPRFRSIIEPETVIISPPPKEQEQAQNPALLTYGPRMTMFLTSGFTLFTTLQSYLAGDTEFSTIIPSLIAIGVMLLSSLFWPIVTKRYTARSMQKNNLRNRRKYLEYLDKKSKKIDDIKSLQRQILIENNVSLEECQNIIYNHNRNLWGKNIADDDFLEVRIGNGKVKSQIEIDQPDDQAFVIEEFDLEERMDDLKKEAQYIDNAPMSVNLVDKRITAVVGNNVLTKYFIDSLFLQIMTFHSYLDLKIVVITSKENEFLWEYLKVTPHAWDNMKTTRYFVTDNEELATISHIIEADFDSRLNDKPDAEASNNDKVATGDSTPYTKHKPYYLIFVDNLEIARNSSLVKKVMSTNANFGFSILYRNNRLSNLPEQCSTFINVDPEKSGLFETNLTKDSQKEFIPELNKTVDMYGCAQVLANVPMQKEKAKFELPNSVSFLEMFNVGKVEQLNSLERWKTNNPVNSLAVPVGINQEGELFKMDAHEKGWGPHGLVAGMTGSGKSEWIISYILALAVNFHPDEVQFVLIDYKGGGLALAFENAEMGIKLPHLAGTITNLDKSAINRALTSIEAELKRRQRLFNEAREKLHESSINIYKYQNYYRKGLLTEPISHLFIISDEFAELKSQEPEFLDQLVSTARIGRSLGVHLILATQKPSGVVNEQIWSNSRFHVCLRVQDQGDSKEMIKTPDAASLKVTGSFYLQVGFNEFYALGQSAWSGAKYHPSDIVKKKVDQSLSYIDNLGSVVNSYDENTFVEKAPEADNGEELLNVVKYISDISKQETIIGKQLWLPNIDPNIKLDEVKKKYNWTHQKYNLNTAIGMYDRPALQEQGLLSIDLSENVVIYGEGGSGKENLLATIIWSSMIEHTPEEVNYYIFDFGAETLRMFAKYPHVGEIVFQDGMENVPSVLQMILDEMDKRKEMFADYNGNYESYIKESGNYLPRWVVVLNAYDIFSESLPRVVGFVETMFRDAPKAGITFVVTTTGAQAVRNKIQGYFHYRIILHQPDESKYRAIVESVPKKLYPANEFGRGLCIINDEEEWCEFQTAFITDREKINQLVRSNGDNFATYYKTHAKTLPKIPDDINSEQISSYITTVEATPVGYDFHEKNIKTFDFKSKKFFTITGNNINSSMQSIYGIINTLSKVPATTVRVFDFNGSYKGQTLDIKYFNDKYDATVVALLRDLQSRTIQQDQGITFIFGVESMKTKLNDIGKEKLIVYFNAIEKANNSTVVLVDSYDNLKRQKVEPWFPKLDTSYGIWLGAGLENQNLFGVNAVDMEDRKLDFKGIAFTVDDGNYSLIKTVMDEE